SWHPASRSAWPHRRERRHRHRRVGRNGRHLRRHRRRSRTQPAGRRAADAAGHAARLSAPAAPPRGGGAELAGLMAYIGFRHHLGLKFVSIALAALLWVAVAGEQTVERALRIPLEFTNLP